MLQIHSHGEKLRSWNFQVKCWTASIHCSLCYGDTRKTSKCSTTFFFCVCRNMLPWYEKSDQTTSALAERSTSHSKTLWKGSFATGCSHKMQLLGRISKRSEMNSREIYEQSTFYKQALSSKRQKEVWNTIHWILHQNPQTIKADSDIQQTFQHNSTASSKLQTKSWKYITWPDWWPSTTTQLFQHH